MSREQLFNIDCTIRGINNISDDYGQFLRATYIKSTPRCSYRYLTGNEIVALGLTVDTKGIRVYMNKGVDINIKDQIIITERIYEVIWINKLGKRTGLTEGVQVDCNFIGFCENMDWSSSSSSSESSSSSDSSSSSLGFSSSSSSSPSSESSSSYMCCVERYSTNPDITARFSDWEIYGANQGNLPDCEIYFVAYTYVIGSTTYQTILVRNKIMQNIAVGNRTSAGWFNLAAQPGSSVSGKVYWNGNFINQSTVVNELICNEYNSSSESSSPSSSSSSDSSDSSDYNYGNIVGWGSNVAGESTPPSGSDYVEIEAGGYHSLALKTDGSIVGWGFNNYGQATPPSGTNYVQVAAGGSHSLALKTDGSIVGWGWNNYGQATPPSGTDYAQISAGSGQHSLALKTDGSIVGWGLNTSGQATPPSGTDYVQIIAGGNFSLALKTDGSIVGWGLNDQGQTNVPSGTDYVQLAAGEKHGLAIVGIL